MKRITVSVLFLVALSIAAAAQASTIAKTDLSQPEIDKIIKKFTKDESLFRQALNAYAFNRSATIQTIGMGGQITGTFRKDSFITFDQAGERFEKVLFAPVSTLTEITITAADLENMGGLDPFAIEPKNLSKYNFSLLGKEKIDELNLFVFEVSPKVIPNPKKTTEKLFSGRIWVDDQDFMIVKTKGKAVPDDDRDTFATMETWRENIDGKYWFPSFTSSDDELVFAKTGQVVKMRIRVKYTNYRLGKTDVKIISEEDIPDEKPQSSPTPEPKKP